MKDMNLNNKIATIFVFNIVIVLIASIMLTNCNKIENTPDIKKENKSDIEAFKVTNADNKLVFNTRADYEEAIDYLAHKGDAFLPIWEEEIGFNSARKIEEENENNEFELDPLFATLLNEDYVIQIGDNIFKIDLENETVLVLKASEYSNLESFNSANVMSFTTSDNVLDILEGIELPDSERGGCPSAKIGPLYWTVYGGHVEYKIVYQKAGIYFSLQSKIKKNFYGGSAYISLSVQPSCWYKPKNRSTQNIPASSQGGYGREYNIRPYQSMRRLDGYRFEVFYYANDSGYGPYSQTLLISC
jgi:hypothetical protein